MANQQFKAALTAAQFPVSYHHASRSVLRPTDDIAGRTSLLFVGAPDNVDFNLIQLLLAENVIPIAKGLQSISFVERYPAYVPAATDFDQLILIQDSSGYVASFCPGRGKNYVLTKELPAWVSYNPFVWSSQYELVTKGYVAGRTLIFYESTKLIEWNQTTLTIDTLTMTLPVGYSILDIRGNSAASNYHLLFTDNTILWSTPQDPLEFADIAQGAGNQIPIDLRGQITAVIPTAGGFIICSTQNMVGASFTNDAARPFAFREILSSGGVQGPEQITDGAHILGHYAFGASGLQQVNLQKADTVFSEVADFLVSVQLDSWDTATKTIISTVRANDLTCKLRFLSSRYLAISYGVAAGQFEFVLLYDTVLARWGKLRIIHVDCDSLPFGSTGDFLMYSEMDVYGTYTDIGTTAYFALVDEPINIPGIRENFGFLQADGTTLLLAVDSVDNTVKTTPSVVIFGHMQVKRDRQITVLSAEADGLAPIPAVEVTLLGSSTGYSRTEHVVMELENEEDGFSAYGTRYTNKNIDVAIEAAFELTNLILETVIHGKR